MFYVVDVFLVGVSFENSFVVLVYEGFHVFRATVAHSDSVSVK